MSKDVLYYDGLCPLCSFEMRKLEVHADAQLQLVDIHTLTNAPGLPAKQALLTRLHLKRADGRLLIGLDASVAAWQHTRFGVLYRWLRWPVIRSVSDCLYTDWAQVRYRRLYRDKRGGQAS